MSALALLGEMQCIRCEAVVTEHTATATCPAAPDRGPHEGLAPTCCRPTGWSLHERGCPRATPFMVGTEVVDAACACRGRT